MTVSVGDVRFVLSGWFTIGCISAELRSNEGAEQYWADPSTATAKAIGSGIEALVG